MNTPSRADPDTYRLIWHDDVLGADVTIVDRLAYANADQGGGDVCDCMACEEFRGLLYMAKLVVSGLESMIKGNKTIRKAGQRLCMKEMKSAGHSERPKLLDFVQPAQN